MRLFLGLGYMNVYTNTLYCNHEYILKSTTKRHLPSPNQNQTSQHFLIERKNPFNPHILERVDCTHGNFLRLNYSQIESYRQFSIR